MNMIMTLKVRKSGNSLSLLLSKPLRQALDIQEGDDMQVEINEEGFVAKTQKRRAPRIVFPMSYEELIAGAQPEPESLIPIEDLHID
ncbi:MAG: AbrB/MazE/SpoVT family DNA-binding domain-containing protein [Psychrosphaera sp.]|nr:AbrB/MazE/SpoVT family DNA-binding domain-containing protein [Psychrosphaera sp.]